MIQRILTALTATTLLVGAALAGEYNEVLSIGDKMPAFTDLPNIDGTTLSSADIEEDIIVMVSLANHCPWVKGMDPDLVKLADKFADEKVRIVGLSFNHREDDRLPAMKKHADKNGYTFDYVFDESQDLGRALGATRTPEYFVFNAERKLVYTGALYDSPAKMNRDGTISHVKGDPSVFYVRDAIAATLGGKAPAVAETAARGCTVKYEMAGSGAEAT